jgi:hypothetical protein
MASGGYVRIHRPLFEDHPAFRNDAEAMAFAWLIVKAAWKPVTLRYKERKVSLKRGQLTVSQRDMAHALDRDKAWIERLWKRLKAEAMITVEVEAGVAVITICNYDQYQADVGSREAVNEAPDEAEVRQAQGTEQVKEEVKEVNSEPKGSSPRAWALPVGVSLQVWEDFLSNRKRKKLGNTETAWKAFNDDLQRVSIQTGIPPPKLIEHAAAKGWGSINDPRNQRNERSSNPTGDAVSNVLRRIGAHH